jgi:hypothetical protein
MKRVFMLSIGVLMVMFLFFCNGGDGNGGTVPPPTNNPIPTLTTISPTSKVAHLPDFTLTATGSDFVSGAKIVFNGTEMTTNYVSTTELTCEIEPDDTALAGAFDGEVAGILTTNVVVLVRNPSPGGGDSGSRDFTVRHNHQFTTAARISTGFPETEGVTMAVEADGTVNACWSKVISYTEEMLYMKRSTDGGDTWDSALQVTKHGPNMPYWPVLAVDESGNLNCLHCRYSDGNVYYHRSTNSGQTWNTPVKLSNPAYPLYTDSSKGDMVVDGSGNINVLFQLSEAEARPGNIYFTRSTNNGASWTTPLLISVSNYGMYPAIAVDGNGNLYAAWKKRKTYATAKTAWYTHLRRSSNGGATWTSGINVNSGQEGHYSGGPKIAVDLTNNYIFLVWAKRDNYFSGNYKVFFSRSTDSGATWSSPLNITANGLSNTYPDMTVDSVGNINVVWNHSDDVYFRRSIDNGSSWSQTVQVCSTPGASYEPVIGVDSSGNIKVAWRDHTTGVEMVYFSRSTY